MLKRRIQRVRVILFRIAVLGSVVRLELERPSSEIQTILLFVGGERPIPRMMSWEAVGRKGLGDGPGVTDDKSID